LKTGGGSGRVEGFERFSIAKYLDLLNGNVSAGEVEHPELIDKMSSLIGAGEGDRSVVHSEDEGCRLLHFRV